MNEEILSEETTSSSATTGRRTFLVRLSIVLGSIGAAIVSIPSVAFLLGLRKTPQLWLTVGKVDDFQVGSTVKVSFSDPSSLPWAGVTAQTAAWLRRVSDQQFVAYSISCTHLGCPVRWLGDAELFMCPCHGGVFYADGTVASGPPPKPLSQYPARVHEGQVQILASPIPIT